ncbi:hypothetical protein [Paludisphaera borealis]|uniref:Uncharacterized protein n=1 Tax=Paludisphaera borealis TaxID=1387353 RepID=A0A1U7CZB5_9BACT|nr:hypothetical protein [Paludisphaera borealis]APW64219.1 hypothetical protein BSF38_05811 [Paludisphaera borealis]
MSKKRTSLDAIMARTAANEDKPAEPPIVVAQKPAPVPPGKPGNRPGVKQQTAYLAEPVYEQLRRLAFEERAKMHDYLIEGLDLVFRKRGLPGVEELKTGGQ